MKKSLDETMVGYARTPSACWDFSSVKGRLPVKRSLKTGWILVGIVGIRDDVRPEAVKAIKRKSNAPVSRLS